MVYVEKVARRIYAVGTVALYHYIEFMNSGFLGSPRWLIVNFLSSGDFLKPAFSVTEPM